MLTTNISPTLAAIIIFTKDRPGTLSKTLDGIKNTNFSVIVLDDSYLIKNRVDNEKEIKNYAFATYHGRKEQKTFLRTTNIKKEQIEKFTNSLGSRKWNLGYARNYAIVLAKWMKFQKILFMDDDIIVESKTLIGHIFKQLDDYDFVGSKITGMIDDSVVGHIIRELKFPSEEYFSGGFLAFKTSIISEYFINQYNEDWIWVYLHELNHTTFLYGTVKQLPFPHFQNAEAKAKKQEIGEMLVDGVKKAVESKDLVLLKSNKFWKRLLIEKQQYYNELKSLCIEKRKPDLYKILSHVAACSSKLEARMFSSLFTNYFAEKKKWVKSLNSF